MQSQCERWESYVDIETLICHLPIDHLTFAAHDASAPYAGPYPIALLAQACLLKEINGWDETALHDYLRANPFAIYLQDRNETLIVLLADTELRVSELVALNCAYLDLDTESGELYLPSEIQKGNPGASYLDLADETRRQLRQNQNRVWKDSKAFFPSRQPDRMTDRSVRNVVTRVAEEAGIRPYRIEDSPLIGV